jgi:hypothetical protein
MKISIQAIESLTSNVATIKNGKNLVANGKFSNMKISQDGSLIWGECAGSGANPYFCSADYIDENKPVLRCNCPSKQFPCKHSIGLLYAFANGGQFVVADIPEDIVNKRAKIEKRLEKNMLEHPDLNQQADKQSCKSKNIKSIIKKIEIQLSGIEMAQKLLFNIVQMGLSSMDAATQRTITRRIQELGNYHIDGIQLAFNNLFVEMKHVKNQEYTDIINQLNYISVLLKKSREYLTERKENPEAKPELTSNIEELIGHIWKLADLMKYGMYETDAEIIQLSYNSYDDAGRKAFVDEGYWLNLKSCKIYKSKNYRPYKAARYIDEENTCFEILQIPELFVYPGNVNPRARWSAEKLRYVTNEDRIRVINSAAVDYAEVVKTAKVIIKNPIEDKNPVVLLKLYKAHLVGEHIVLEDERGNKLTVADLPEQKIYTETSLKAVLPTKCDHLAITVMINNSVKTGLFSVTGLSLIAADKIIRLLY